MSSSSGGFVMFLTCYTRPTAGMSTMYMVELGSAALGWQAVVFGRCSVTALTMGQYTIQLRLSVRHRRSKDWACRNSQFKTAMVVLHSGMPATLLVGLSLKRLREVCQAIFVIVPVAAFAVHRRDRSLRAAHLTPVMGVAVDTPPGAAVARAGSIL